MQHLARVSCPFVQPQWGCSIWHWLCPKMIGILCSLCVELDDSIAESWTAKQDQKMSQWDSRPTLLLITNKIRTSYDLPHFPPVCFAICLFHFLFMWGLLFLSFLIGGAIQVLWWWSPLSLHPLIHRRAIFYIHWFSCCFVAIDSIILKLVGTPHTHMATTYLKTFPKAIIQTCPDATSLCK